jgi:exonuclease SbcC
MRNLDEEEKRLVEVKSQWAFYEKLLAAYGKDGIPMVIVKNELPRINDEIAKILQGVTGFTVTLETDNSGSDLDIYLDYGDSRRPIELGSGMEKMLSSLAIRVALINISCLPKSDILIIDEGFGALDEQNVEACNKLLHSLKRFFKTVLVISHVDAVKDAVDGFIEVTTRGSDAHVSAADSLPNN